MNLEENDNNFTSTTRTAIRKVKDNETLSIPFRQQPRHAPSKSAQKLVKSDAQQNEQIPQPGNEKVVILKNTGTDSVNSSNNNIQNGFSITQKSAKIPPRDRNQEEINREFQAELLKAKSKLRTSARSETTHSSNSESKAAKEDDGSPPPPPPPVLPNTLVQKTQSVRERPPIKSHMNPREELMLAIRNKGGVKGLKPVGVTI